jgi:negative regulator of sigma E activity
MKAGLHESTRIESVIPPEVFTAVETTYNNTTQAAASGIDTQGYDEMVVEAHIGAFASGALDIAVHDSATDDGTAATAFTDDSSVAADFDQMSASDANTVKLIRVRCKDMNRYAFIVVTNADTGSKALGVTVHLASADSRPVSQQQTVDFTHENA